jgi:small subunit ribosomal protein S20
VGDSIVQGFNVPYFKITMPNSPSAKKRLRQSLDRRARNRAARSTLRTAIRKVRTLIAGGDADAANAEFRTLVKKLDQAAAKGILHANTAARIKSRVSKAIKELKSGAATA